MGVVVSREPSTPQIQPIGGQESNPPIQGQEINGPIEGPERDGQEINEPIEVQEFNGPIKRQECNEPIEEQHPTDEDGPIVGDEQLEAEQPFDGPMVAEQSLGEPIVAEQSHDGPLVAEEPICGPVVADQPIVGPMVAEQPTDGPILSEHPIDGQIVAELSKDGPIVAEESIYGPILAEQHSDKSETNISPPNPEVDATDEEGSTWWDWLKWCPSSKKVHRELERSILESLALPYRFRSVNIGPVVGSEDCKIWTLSVNESSDGLPLVLLHGFGSGLALWALNLDELGMNRPVYAFDLLGFGASSRPKFSSTPEAVENEFIASIEAWRVAMGIERFVIVGHSFGGFLASVYSIRYPQVVQGLCLADPWGVKQCPENVNLLNLTTPLIILLRIFVPFNLTPLWALRLLGRIAPSVIRYCRQDLIQNFVPQVKDASRVLSHYIYQCNARTPTGEAAFNVLMASFGWAQNPLSHRIHELNHRIPLTIINGARSWIDHSSPEEIDDHRGRMAFVETVNIDGCGHHVYTENRLIFNKIVLQACMNIKSEDIGIRIQDVTAEEEEEEISRIEELDPHDLE